MTIINIQRVSVGQVGVAPGTIKMVTSDNLSTITAAGYLKNQTAAGTISPLDIVEVIYSYNGVSGTYGMFTVSVSSGVNTLTPWVDSGNVLLPVVDGNVSIFNGTSGQVKDSGAAMSNASNLFFATSAGSLTSGNITKLADGNGSVGDAGFNMSIVDIPVTLSAWNAMYNTPIPIIAAAGANTAIVLHKAWINFIYGSAALTSGGNVVFTYGNGSHIGAGAIQATATQQTADFTGASASTWYTFTAQTGNNTQITLSNIANTGVYLSNATGVFATGTGGSFFVRALYSVLSTNS